jgi:hypothetical protein
MNRLEMLKNLHELDKRLWITLDIEIGGASSAILQNALKRTSGDIDVINSSFPLNDPKIRRILDEIGKNPNEKESWLNQSARDDILRIIPKTYKFDQENIVGEVFKKLHPKIISKADFVICKLLIKEDERRLHDLPDVKNLLIDRHDVDKIYEKLNKLSIERHSLALKIEGVFKQIRPEFLATEKGLPYSNSSEIAQYYHKRYGVQPSKNMKEEWDHDIDRMIRKPASIVGELDYNIGKEIENGNTAIAQRDREYREHIRKVMDYGLDL